MKLITRIVGWKFVKWLHTVSDEKLRVAADNDRQIVANDKIHSSPLFEKQ